MATVTSAAVTIPSFTGLKAGTSASKPATSVRIATSAPKLSIKASLKDFGVAVAATATAAAVTVLLAGNAVAAEVKLGGDDGSLAFVPGSITVKSGETITFTNNAGFPHNVVFDEDEVPAGVNAEKISQSEYLNAAGDVYTVTLTEKGTYKIYCEPHQGAGMKGEIIVE